MLAGQLRQARVLVLATYRDGEVGAEHPLVETLAVLSRQPMVRRVVLAGLDAAEVGEFIAAATGGQPSGSLVEVVHGRTDGNPFFVAELVRLLDRDGGLSGEGAQARLGAAVPAGVR